MTDLQTKAAAAAASRSKSTGFPENHRDNLLSELLNDLTNIAEAESLSHHQAFGNAALEWVGAEAGDAFVRSDGANDRGVDYFRLDGETLTIIQTKSQDFPVKGRAIDCLVGPEYLTDIPRVLDLLKAAVEPQSGTKRPVRHMLKELQAKMRSLRNLAQEAPGSEPVFTVDIVLCLLAKGLTSAAESELESLKKGNTSINICGAEVLCDIRVMALDDFLAARWKVRNNVWRNASGKNEERILLHASGDVIDDKTSLIFYTRAIDLVDAYNKFGYQIFEPNVRCEIRKSSVNTEIEKQVRTERGIEKFRYLNNGVTIICDGKSHTADRITVTRPGIVNGLQTVTTLAKAYDNLSPELKEIFSKNCCVLARVYQKAKVDVPELVKATNHQNPMEPRNLRSNEPEQIAFEQQFAELGWFYQRKEFAWEAFASNEKNWPTLRNKKRQAFQGNCSRP